MNTDDPRITAYALDALAASERREVEAALAENADLRNEVTQVEEVSAALSEAFRMRPQVGLSAAQREAIRAAASKQLLVPEPVQGHASQDSLPETASGVVEFPSNLRHARFPAPLVAAGIGAIAAGLAVMVAVNLSGDGASPQDVAGGLTTRAVMAGEEESGTMRVQIIGSKASEEEVRILAASGTRPLPKLAQPEGSASLVEVAIPNGGAPQGMPDTGTRRYTEPAIVASATFLDPTRDPLSNLPVQGGQELVNSYASVRQALNLGAPLPQSIRVSDMVGHFDFSMPTVADEAEVSYAAAEVADCPWQPDHLLARVLLRSPGGEFTAEDLQVEFNPSVVESYRLLGFSEAQKGANVMALYQIVPHAAIDDSANAALVDRGDGEIELRYGTLAAHPAHPTANFPEGDPRNRELLVITTPGEYGAQLPLELQRTPMSSAAADFRFAAAVVGFSMLIDDSVASDSSASEPRLSYDQVISLAETALGADEDGERKRFVELVKAARDRVAR